MRRPAIIRTFILLLVVVLASAPAMSMAVSAMPMAPCPMADGMAADSEPCCPDCVPDGMNFAACMSLCAAATAILDEWPVIIGAASPDAIPTPPRIIADRPIKPEPLPPKSIA